MLLDPSLEALASAVLVLDIRPERVLEVECGDAEGTLFLAREYPGARVRGVDRSAEEVRRATARIGLDPEGRVAFKHSPGGGLPFPDGLFDLVVQRRGRVRPGELARVLRRGGRLLLIDPTAILLERRLRARGFEPAPVPVAVPLRVLSARLG